MNVLVWVLFAMRQLCAYTLSGIAVLMLSVFMPFMPRLVWLSVCRLWARSWLWALGVRLKVRGQENLVGPAIFVGDHGSWLGFIALLALLPRDHSWISTHKFFSVPIWGAAFSGSGVLMLPRKPEAQNQELMRKRMRKRAPDWSIAVFLQDQNDVIVEVACSCRLPVVPIAVECGSSKTIMVRPCAVNIVVGTPLNTDAWSTDEVEAHGAELREAMQHTANG